MSEAAVRMLSSSSSWVLAPSCSPEIVRVATRITSTPSSEDRKSTRLNSSHLVISYAVFCLKKKNYAPILISSLDPQRVLLTVCAGHLFAHNTWIFGEVAHACAARAEFLFRGPSTPTPVVL